MAKGPVISIIVPVYQVEKYVGRCISSLLSQKFTDFEIICVDDGTKDRSCEIIEEFAKQDNRIRLFHKSNGGLSSARNEGLKYAEGEYVWYVDSDDFVKPEACSVIYREILEHRPDMITFGAIPVPEQYADKWLVRVLWPGYLILENHPQEKNKADRYDCEESVKAFVRYPGAWPFVWRCCFNRQFLLEHELVFDENVKFGEDTVFLSEAYPQTKRITFLSERLYYYRCVRKGSLMDSYKDQHERLVENCHIAHRVLEYWRIHGWIELYGNYCLEWLIHFVGYDAVKSQQRREQKELSSIVFKLISRYDLSQYRRKLPLYDRYIYTKIQLICH